MNSFLDDNFLLHSQPSIRLFHDYARDMPIIDYHCHLSARLICENTAFENLTQAWLAGDHYKWRAMRTHGVDESYCSGKKSDWEKFEQWAATVPFTMRNPLYHWTHLELMRYFGVNALLGPQTAFSIFSECAEKLQSPGYRVRDLLRKMKVQILCTTNDPIDDLFFHKQICAEGFEILVLPTFRPDRAMQVDEPGRFREYLADLEKVTGMDIYSFQRFLDALRSRHDYFAQHGCVSSDHGLAGIDSVPCTAGEMDKIFNQLINGRILQDEQCIKFRSFMLHQLAQWDWEKDWVQQYHLGAIRNNNSRMLLQQGPDSGWDSMGDALSAKAISFFLDRLDREGQLAKTILYNVNPAHNAMLATMIGNFNDGSRRGKMQWGSAWWFLDQRQGMTEQLNALSNIGLLSAFVGMITDSRSFLSYPRHEYFRRILCDLFGQEVERGELPNDLPWIGKLIKDICYYNARDYFNWPNDTRLNKRILDT